MVPIKSATFFAANKSGESFKPTEKECTDGLAALQSAWDLENNSYKSKRRAAYPSQEEQWDMQYWDQVNGTTTWKDAIAKVKSDYPKPN